jgi:hypothetical protein
MTFTLEELGQRLRELPITTPDAGAVATRVLHARQVPAARPRPIVRVARPLAVSLLFVVALWGVFYFAPAAGAALADAPGVGSFSSFVLGEAGLGTGNAVTSEDSAAANSGVTIRLIGASANPLRTIVLLRISPATDIPIGMTLKDQFGWSYEERGGYGDLRTGDLAMMFAPPSFLAQPLGMRFKLLIDGVETGTGPVSGAWTLTGTVLAHGARSFAAPQPATDGRLTVTFSAGRESDGVLELTARIQGVTMEQLGIGGHKQTSDVQPLTVTVTDSSGRELDVPFGFGPDPTGITLDIIANGASDHGTYTIRIFVLGVGSVERSITVG